MGYIIKYANNRKKRNIPTKNIANYSAHGHGRGPEGRNCGVWVLTYVRQLSSVRRLLGRGNHPTVSLV